MMPRDAYSFRIDVASDAAFLTMDLEDRGRPDLAHRFLNGYLEATGDYGLLVLLPFYLTYRAIVRAKVAGIRLGQSHLSPKEEQQVREAFGSYVDLAERYTRPSRPRLLITHGLSGSGKTFATQQLVEATGAIRLRSDVERKRLCGLAPLERSTDRSELDLYAPAVTQRTYAHLAQQAARVIAAGFTVVVDATFLQRAQRDAFRHLAAQLNVPCTILACRAPAETLRRRVAQRSAQAAREIKQLISDSVQKVDSGSRQVTEAGQTMRDIVDQVRRVADLIGEITSATLEQDSGIGQVNAAVTQLDQMTQQNAALVEQSAAAAESLKEQAARLAQALAIFKLGRQETAQVIAQARASAQATGRPAPRVERAPKAAPDAPKPRAPKMESKPLPKPTPPPAPNSGNDDWEEF